jgi:hypothetical protein
MVLLLASVEGIFKIILRAELYVLHHVQHTVKESYTCLSVIKGHVNASNLYQYVYICIA